MDTNKILNYCLSKTINNLHYRFTRKTILNDKFTVLCHFLSPKQHQPVNLFCCAFLNFKTTQNNRFTVLSRCLSFQMVNLSFQTVNLSFYVVLLIILEEKNDKNSTKFIFCYRFSSKNPTQIINLSFCVIFASIKLP